MPDFNRQMENLSAAAQRVVDTNAQYSELTFAADEARSNGELTRYSTLRQQMAAKGQQYQQAVIAREQAKSAFVQALKRTPEARYLDDDALLFIASWIDRRTHNNPEKLTAAGQAANLFRDLAGHFRRGRQPRSLSMISRCFRFFLFLPLLLLVTVPALARQTPEAVLKEIQTAIDASDLAAFERRVDVDALLDQSSSTLITALQKAGQVDTSGLPPMLALMVASVQDPSMAKQIKGLLVQETGTFTRSGIESGFFAGKPKANAKPKGLLAPLFGNVSTGRKELRPRGASRKVNGNVILPATIHDFGNGRDYKVDLGMSPSGESWKVTSIANMDKLVSRLQKEAAE